MTTDALSEVLLGRRAPTPKGSSLRIVEGRIRSGTATAATFTVPAWDDGRHVFGPAPLNAALIDEAVSGDHGPHIHEPLVPSQGSLCLVLFLGNGVDNAYILGWWK